MYLPPAFEETRLDVLHALIGAYPLATVVTHGAAGLAVNLLPLLLDAPTGASGTFGTLRGHVARANPLWRELAEGESLLVFQGPQAYVSPNWYPGKAAHGKAVPTWNYCLVEVRGSVRIIDDAAWVLQQASDLTDLHEATLPAPWALADAPADYVAQLAGQIVGVEWTIASLRGKWKMSQNQPAANRAGVVQGLMAQGPQQQAVAAIVAAGDKTR